MEKQSKDKSIAWKATGMHHPMFGIFYQDYHAIIHNFLPIIQSHNFDAFFNGHEHLNAYAAVSRDYKLNQKDYNDGIDCQETAEWFLSEAAIHDSEPR